MSGLPLKKRKSIGGEELGRLLSRIPWLDPHRLIGKVSKASRPSLAKHARLPVVLPGRPGKK